MSGFKKTSQPRLTVAERYHSRYEIDKVTGCWNWTAGKFPSGYGALYVNGSNRPAHRVGYELVHGPIGEGFHLDHLCRNRGCVNPDHLEPVTIRENILRGSSPSALTSVGDMCRKGHSMDDSFIRSNGKRQCRSCHYEYAKLRKAGLVGGQGGGAGTNRCRNGHEYTEENTRVLSSGHRQCIECRRKSCRDDMDRERTKRGVANNPRKYL
jgi:hypothetical protein